MSDLKCVLVPKWVFVLYEDAPTGVSQVGSECDFCMWHWSLFFFFFLCQSGTPVIKKLLRIALTVRLFVGNEMNCSPCLSASMKDPFVFVTLKVWDIHCNRSAFLPGEIDSLLLSRMDVWKSEAGEFLLRRKKKKKKVRCHLPSCFLRAREGFWTVCVTIHTHKKTLKHFITLSEGGQTTLELYMHQSADQILVVVVLMFITCVLIIKHNVIYWNYMEAKLLVLISILSHFTFDVNDRNKMCR